MDLVKSFRFEAAHETPWEEDEQRLHGHSYEVDIVVSGPCDERLGWVIDYAEISAHFEPVFKALDHRLLNNVEGLEDSSVDGVRAYISACLKPRLPLLKEVVLTIVGEQEFRPFPVAPNDGLSLPARLRFGFEAAHALPHLPEDHKCRRMHGHSFIVDVGAKDLDAVEPYLRDVYNRLDHRCLNDVTGLENPTSEAISRWIWHEIEPEKTGVTCVVVAETCTARCIYHGN